MLWRIKADILRTKSEKTEGDETQGRAARTTRSRKRSSQVRKELHSSCSWIKLREKKVDEDEEQKIERASVEIGKRQD